MNAAQTRQLTWPLFFWAKPELSSLHCGHDRRRHCRCGLERPAGAGWSAGGGLGLGTALGAYPAARLMERAGRRRGLLVGYAAGIANGLLAMVAVLTGNFVGPYLGFAGMGVARRFIDLGWYAAAEMNPAGARARAISLVLLGGTLGALVGPALVAPMGSWASSLGAPALAGSWIASAVLYLVVQC